MNNASNSFARLVRSHADAIINLRGRYKDRMTPSWVEDYCASYAIGGMMYANDVVAIHPRYRSNP